MPDYQYKTFVWRELYTKDVAKAKAFYSGLLGWTFQTMPMEKGVYHMMSAGAAPVGGMMGSDCGDMPPDVPSYWSSYVSVPSVDDCCTKAKANGGKVLFGPMDIPHVGRMASLMDPQGAVICVFTSAKGDMPPSGPPPVGSFCWETLTTSDPLAAKAFYTDVIGWVEKPFPGGGEITVFSPSSDHPYGCASMNAAHPGVPTHWATNIYIENLAASNEKVRKLGGSVMVEEIVVPTIGKVSVVSDPMNAVFCLFEPNVQM